jgi:hypothetical protein
MFLFDIDESDDLIIRKCAQCGEEKPLTEYFRTKQGKRGRSYSCKICDYRKKRSSRERVKAANPAEYARRWREYKKRYELKNPERAKRCYKNTYLKRDFGISIDEYEEMVRLQNGVCKICGNPDRRRGLAVDHDHSTGVIRGLLCSQCNTALGLFKDNPAVLGSAIQYLLEAENR